MLYHSFVSFISFVVDVWIVAFAMAAFIKVFRFFVGPKWGEMVIKEAEGTIEVLKADIEKAIVDAVTSTKEIDEDCKA